MDLNIIVPICTAIGTIIMLWGLIGRRFDKMDMRFDRVEKELKNQGNLLTRIETILEMQGYPRYNNESQAEGDE